MCVSPPFRVQFFALYFLSYDRENIKSLRDKDLRVWISTRQRQDTTLWPLCREAAELATRGGIGAI